METNLQINISCDTSTNTIYVVPPDYDISPHATDFSESAIVNDNVFYSTTDSTVSHIENDNFIFMIDPNIFVNEISLCHDDVVDTPFPAVNNIRLKYAKNVIFSHINVNSLRRKFDEMRCLLDNGYVDILCISETKLDSADKNCLFHVDNYTMFRQDKRKNSGGIMIFINECIPCRQVDLNLDYISLDIEIMLIELIFENNDKWLLCCLYKNPKVTDNEFDNYFTELCNKISSRYDDYVFIGDFNMNFFEQKSRIHDICSTHGLHNLIKSPTCWKGNVGTMIDLFLVPKSDKTRFLKGYSEDIGTSDFHSLILIPMRKYLPVKPKEFTYYRNVKKINYEQVRTDLLDLLQKVRYFHNAEESFNNFHQCLSSIFNKHAPILKRKCEKKSFPIMNTKLRCGILYRNRLRNRFYKTKSITLYALYKSARNKVTQIKRDIVSSYFQRKCKGATSNKHFWNTINPFLSQKMRLKNNIILKDDDKIVTDPINLCNIFCDFFSNIGVTMEPENNNRPLFSIIHDNLKHPSIETIKKKCAFTHPFTLKETNIVKMKEAIQNLATKKAAGCDDIPPIFIKTLKNDISEVLVILFNNCIRDRIFPSSLKMANITPVYKKKDRLNKDNYRSINLLPIISKLFERLIADQIEVHCKTFFHPMLSGFRKKYGCSDLLCKLLSDWKSNLDNKKFIGVIAIDLSKAFDCMPIGLLLSKLYAYGFSYDTCFLLKSYLCSRKQRVKIGNNYSQWASPSCGVPQGSILGPALFNIFLNDILYSQLYSSIYNYADDNTLSISGEDINEVRNKLCHDMGKVCTWFEENKMKANPDKFQAMFMGPKINSSDIEIKFSNITLKGTNLINILGVEFDQHLDFTNHLQGICNKTNQQINATMRIKANLDEESRLAIYNSFIVSNFNYCNIVWSFGSKSTLTKLDKINERAVRMIYDDKWTPYDVLLKDKCHLDVFRICYKSMCISMYKIWNDISPTYLRELFNKRVSDYNLRNTQAFDIPNFNTKTHGYYSFPYLGAKAWSGLDNKLKRSNSLESFKKGMKCYVSMKNKYDIINDFY